MTSRRSFLKTAACAGIMTLALPDQLLAMQRKKSIGIQLYTLHDIVREDFAGSMEYLAKIGFTIIETAGYKNGTFYGYRPAEFKKFMQSQGLRLLSNHANLTRENIVQTIEDSLEAGMKYIVQPWLHPDKRKTINDYQKLAEDLNYFGELANLSGLTLAYHNHDFEFMQLENQIPYDYLLNSTDPEKVTMQLDTYWMVYAGSQPLEYIDKYPGRFKLWHFKDMTADERKISTELGTGIIDFNQIVKAREKAGMEYVFLEQEHFEMDPWESVEISYNYLEKLLY